MHQTITRAGIRQIEFAKLVGVERVTAHNWMRRNNPTRPHRYIQERLDTLLATIERATSAGALPLEPGLKPDERFERLTKLLEQFETVT